MSKAKNQRRIGVVLLGFGGPTSLDDVKPFLTNVFGGREVPPLVVEKTIERYQTIGGRSPYLEITSKQAKALENQLNQGKDTFKVYIGMYHSSPLITETVEEISKDGIEKLIALSLSPHYSKATTGSYFEKLKQALTEREVSCEVTYVRSWCDHPLYLEALAEKIAESLRRFSEEERDKVELIFSAHSLPEGLIAEGDPYVEQLRRTIEGVLKLIGSFPSHLAFQSKGREGKWLEPNVDFVLEDLVRRNGKIVLLVPIGFISDHIETLYDIDIVYRRKAEELGLVFLRSASLNDSPKLIEALADVVEGALR